MAWLKYYQWENEEYKDLFERKLSFRDAEALTQKLARHFKLGQIDILWGHTKMAGKAIWLGGYSKHRIQYHSRGVSMGVVAHEIAHLWARKTARNKAYALGVDVHSVNRAGLKGEKHGSKIFKKCHAKAVAYCRKKYLNAQITRLLKAKEAPTKEAIRSKKTEALQKKIERYEKKITFYQNKLKKAQRSLKSLKRARSSTRTEHSAFNRLVAGSNPVGPVDEATIKQLRRQFNAVEEPIEVL